MSRFLPEPPHQHGTAAKTAVVIVNLGTPEAPTAGALRRYLRQFLSDPRVVEIPRLLWWPILNGIILAIRPRKSAAKYASVWMPEGSPLRIHTEQLAKHLAAQLLGRGHQVSVTWAMRYGKPSIGDVLSHVKAEGATRILLLPLYPQYAASTTATVIDEAAQWLRQCRNQPEMRFVRNFHDHPGYLAALEKSIRQHWQRHGPLGERDRLLISFHGLPRRSLDLGDPYFCECHKTARLLAERLQLDDSRYALTFQSRFGKAEWLQPYTAPTLAAWGKEGVERVDVVCPGFVADCLETLEEIALEGKADFLQAGGKTFHYIPCLNASPDGVHALGTLLEQHLQGWPTREAIDPNALACSAKHAIHLGAHR